MILFDRYELTFPRIGKGGFSEVYKAYDNVRGEFVALKKYNKDDINEKYSLESEKNRVKEFNHENVCNYYDFHTKETTNEYQAVTIEQWCAMELIEGGHLDDYIKEHKDQNVIKKLLLDTLKGLSYIHKSGLIHRDIKPQNILIKDTPNGPVAKITDFGISKKIDSNSSKSFLSIVGSIHYMAPEINRPELRINGKVAPNLDLWSFGVMVLELVYGGEFFEEGDSPQILTHKVQTIVAHLPDPYKTILSKCLTVDANQRVTSADELLKFLTEYSGNWNYVADITQLLDKSLINQNIKEIKDVPIVPIEEKKRRPVALYLLLVLIGLAGLLAGSNYINYTRGAARTANLQRIKAESDSLFIAIKAFGDNSTSKSDVSLVNQQLQKIHENYFTMQSLVEEPSALSIFKGEEEKLYAEAQKDLERAKGISDESVAYYNETIAKKLNVPKVITEPSQPVQQNEPKIEEHPVVVTKPVEPEPQKKKQVEIACTECSGRGYLVQANERTCNICDGSGKRSRTCSSCSGNGTKTCFSCKGIGNKTSTCSYCKGERTLQCKYCLGTGWMHNNFGQTWQCRNCNGRPSISCPRCSGAGEITRDCTTCRGTGSKDCSSCDGTGSKDETCSTCGGGGTVSSTERSTCLECNGRKTITIWQ